MWFKTKGNDSDIVISTRIRLARNFKNIKFPGKMTDEEANLVINRVKDIFTGDNYKYINLLDISDLTKMLLLEEHIISPQIASVTYPCGVLTDPDNNLSIMINEEDHLRMQCIVGGYNLEGAYDILNAVDNKIEAGADYAFCEKFGYLTKCPTNVGTGMRASVMLHLPGLTITENIGTMVAAVNKLGVTVRGLYGEGSHAKACIYQVSNQVTLGITEEETLQKLKNVVDMLVEKERQVCQVLYENNPSVFKDKVFRALALLSGAYIMSSEEFMNLIPYVRMGINTGIIKNVDISDVNSLIIELQPAHIAANAEIADTEHRDEKRAEILRSKLTS